jgi:UrcA family protein
MRESKRFGGLVATFIVVGFGASSGVSAQTMGPIDVVVSFADLNIENEAGAKVLYARLLDASREVCGSNPMQSSGTIGRLNFDRCYRETLAEAVAEIDKESLTRVHSG